MKFQFADSVSKTEFWNAIKRSNKNLTTFEDWSIEGDAFRADALGLTITVEPKNESAKENLRFIVHKFKYLLTQHDREKN
jgi:hypothetical protein